MHLVNPSRTRSAAASRGLREHCADGVTEHSLVLRQQPYIGRPQLKVTNHM